MAAIGFVPNSGRPRAVELAKATAAWVEQMGHEALVLSDPKSSCCQGEDCAGLDLLVSIGGDGTMLRSVGMVLNHGVPVLGVNFGRFGFLTSVEPVGLQIAIERFLKGDYELEHRMTIGGRVLAKGGGAVRLAASALNDIVLTHPSGVHTIGLSLLIGGVKFLSYTADAMIVATPTGSTGYNLSARGPIVSPTLRCQVLTPVSPHMFFDRSLIVAATDEVCLELVGADAAELIVDGAQVGRLEHGESLVCRAGEFDAAFVSFGGRGFEAGLKSKFHLTDR
jgi:NAD+ kinase